MAIRTFTARWGSEEIELTPVPHVSGHGRTSIWQAQRAGVPFGYLVISACDGMRFSHPEAVSVHSPGYIAITRQTPAEGTYGYRTTTRGEAIGATVDRALTVSRVQDVTAPCSEAAFSILMDVVAAYVHGTNIYGEVPEGEAWTQAVVMPASMAHVGRTITMTDLRRALIANGWRQTRNGTHWAKKK